MMASEWLVEQFKLPYRGDFREHFGSNCDPQRAIEFGEFYLAHPELRGWRRNLLAEMVADSIQNLWRDDLWPFTIKDVDQRRLKEVIKRLSADRIADHYLFHFLCGLRRFGEEFAELEKETIYYEATGRVKPHAAKQSPPESSGSSSA